MTTKINIKTSNNAFRERTETLKRYYDDIRRYEVMTKDEEIKYFKLYKNGTPKEKEHAYNMIINSNQRFVIGVAKRYATDDNILDLIEEGNVGLIEAFHKYDVSLGHKFISYAVHYIRRAINSYLVNYNEVIHRSNNNKVYHLASKARNIFVQRNLRQPTSEELLEVLNNEFNANLKNENDLNDMNIMSIDVNYDSDTEIHGDDYSIYNEYTSQTNEYKKDIESDFNKFMVNKIINILSEKEQKILRLSFGIGYDREYEMCEVGKIVGLTPERVRQLKNQALNKLKKAYKKALGL